MTDTSKRPNAGELMDSELDKVVGGTDVVGGALVAGKVAVPWAVPDEDFPIPPPPPVKK